MKTPHEFGRRASLFVLSVALSYSLYTYLSGDFGGLGFILRLTKNPMAYAWPSLRVIFVLQILIAIGASGFWRQTRTLRWISLSSICLAVFIQTVLLISNMSLAFDPQVRADWFILPLQLLITVLLFACLTFSLTRKRQANKSVSPISDEN